MEEKDIVKVTLHYEDGTTKDIDKGIMMTEKPGDEPELVSVTFYPVNMRELDIASVTVAIMQLANKLGVFDKIKADGREPECEDE